MSKMSGASLVAEALFVDMQTINVRRIT